MVATLAPVRIMARTLLRRLSEALSLVAVGDRPYYRHGAGYCVGQQVLRLEARTLGCARNGQRVLDPRPLRRAGILIEQPRNGGFPAAVGDLEIALP